MSTLFRTLCEELSTLQVRMIRRDGNPSLLVQEAIQAICRNQDAAKVQQQNMLYVPLFLRSCATLLAHANTDPAYEALLCAGKLAKAYVEANHGDVNESATVLRSLVVLSHQHKADGENGSESGVLTSSPMMSLVAPSLHNTYRKWQQHQVRPHTSTLLALLQGTNAVYGEGFKFTSVGADMVGLLPIKSKVQMEAKMQRCLHSRSILTALRDMQLSKLDAGICLNCQAEFGLYDAELCNVCCDVLFSTHALVTSQQLAQVVYSLGILQHRHIHQKFFSSLIDFKKCNSEGVRQLTMGLAMLRQPPPNESTLLDGIFLHALRSHKPLEFRSSTNHVLAPVWFIDVGHALTCLGITHYKYRLIMTRTVRRSIAHFSTRQRCKMLYGIGGISTDSVPEDLRQSWKGKVVRTVEVLTERLRCDVDPSDGPFVMNALLFAGVREHPMIPVQPDLGSGENPVEVLLRTWATCPKERVLYLTERIQSRHLGREPTATLSHLFSVIASNYSLSDVDSYRFGPLCDAVNSHGGDMSIEEALNTIGAIQRIGIGGRYREALVTLLENLWRQRNSMMPEQQARCFRLVEGLGHLEVAMELLEYMAST